MQPYFVMRLETGVDVDDFRNAGAAVGCQVPRLPPTMGARMLASGLLLAAASVNAQHTPGQFPPGWNKVALTPPM
jgi:hypothetical protein